MISCANPFAQFESHRQDIELAIAKVLNSGSYILGQEVSSFEIEFAKYLGLSHVAGVANGTDALQLVLEALEIGPGDEVITVSHTAVATITAIESVGGIPVLVDIDPRLYTMNLNQLSEVLTTKTKAIIAVHLYGQSCDMDVIVNFCSAHNLKLIEDVSQAHGGRYKDKMLGTFGIAACFSCYPTKNLGAIGDAGLIATNNSEVDRRIRSLRQYGWTERYISAESGRNSRLDELQAAILRVKLKTLDVSNEKRQSLARTYDEQLDGVGDLVLPKVLSSNKHVYHLYAIQTGHRDQLLAYLKKHEIYPGVHYPVPVHLQPYFKGRTKVANSMAETEKLSLSELSLPIYPEMTQAECFYVAGLVKNYFMECV